MAVPTLLRAALLWLAVWSALHREELASVVQEFLVSEAVAALLAQPGKVSLVLSPVQPQLLVQAVLLAPSG